MSEIHLVTTAPAREVLDDKPYIKIYGPDPVLREAKRAVLAKIPDARVQLCATDNYALAQIETDPLIERRFLIVSPVSPMWEALFKEWKQEVTVVVLEDGKLLAYDKKSITDRENKRVEAEVPPEQQYRFQDGTVKDKAVVIIRVADNTGLSADAVTALKQETFDEAAHAAFAVEFDPAKVGQTVQEPSKSKKSKKSKN